MIEKERLFVVHKHEATRLHYDFRIEIDGVLKSWAIPKVPPTEKGIKRLAVYTEDHPLDYIHFEGTIPDGNYGAGKVEIWDSGKFVLLENLKDKIVIDIKGDILKGKYCLIKFKDQEKNWLFFKCG
ncbi:MAG TPA: DNA polymerase ligase N-terminal domain-containing protein [Methanofastidiosum sp.]|jgi:DNA ligase D-like protein (predicted 3'-phosphoesterase)|nr:DNA polymerase ligase N-terminal domain-containing protein [Methanofastidiosum sp.]HOC77784.1 DNA polymerase ligase N-terminal domain-containing protein [Methanofastidiosum sp.]HOG73583.1 DNA polymerase ligase N-terminal domain-containing protein [Methanofastidiosum sp.]HPA49159.1 DNA polymerase ligase N-terminal domain-containing protein [Methanofastidiosum sp.]HQK62431.1 DNA polymerase ligase N-terminal domain-containing protein [Methanofastidiosum sp.]